MRAVSNTDELATRCWAVVTSYNEKYNYLTFRRLLYVRPRAYLSRGKLVKPLIFLCVTVAVGVFVACNELLDNNEPKLLGTSGGGGASMIMSSASSSSGGGSTSSSSGAAGCDASSDPTWSHWKPVEPKVFTVNSDTVVDPVTQLKWARASSAQALSLGDAEAYCSSLQLDGSGVWRLPARIELSSIVDFGKTLPAIDSSAFPSTVSDCFWSSSPYAASPDKGWSVYFSDGYVYPNLKGKLCYARCVRE